MLQTTLSPTLQYEHLLLIRLLYKTKNQHARSKPWQKAKDVSRTLKRILPLLPLNDCVESVSSVREAVENIVTLHRLVSKVCLLRANAQGVVCCRKAYLACRDEVRLTFFMTANLAFMAVFAKISSQLGILLPVLAKDYKRTMAVRKKLLPSLSFEEKRAISSFAATLQEQLQQTQTGAVGREEAVERDDAEPTNEDTLILPDGVYDGTVSIVDAFWEKLDTKVIDSAAADTTPQSTTATQKQIPTPPAGSPSKKRRVVSSSSSTKRKNKSVPKTQQTADDIDDIFGML
ncbi:hypothetical protein HDV03_003784 [Kappamyces sp. JEL0829]|nr:hypothetical protein HDV03_003784 [Kappamyces sp. JEL0829]